MNMEYFEAEFIALMNRYDIPQALLLFQDGPKLCIRASACDDIALAGVGVLANAVIEAVNTENCKEAVQNAMLEAAK